MDLFTLISNSFENLSWTSIVLLLTLSYLISPKLALFSPTGVKNLNFAIKKIFVDIKKNKTKEHNVILFSPASASFDSFKNFEERGKYFNNQIKKQVNA